MPSMTLAALYHPTTLSARIDHTFATVYAWLYDRVTQEHKLLASYGPYAGVTSLRQGGHAYAELEAHGGGGV